MALDLMAFGATDVGRKRRHNEDSLLIDPDVGLYIVADGMGGHAAGDVASSYAIEVAQEVIVRERETLIRLALEPSAENRAAAQALVERAIQTACAEVHRISQAELAKRGMGTTFVCLVRAGDYGVIGHVGDSRAYLLRQGLVHRLTEDHTLVASQIKAGNLTAEEAAASPFANVLTRAVGIQPSVQVDTLPLDFIPGDMFLLCSDGLHGYLDDAEVPGLLAGAPPDQLPARLVQLANDRGGKDNVTALVVQCFGSAGQDRAAADSQARMDAFKRIPLFQHLDYKEQTALLAVADTAKFGQGDVIVREGAEGDALFVVLRGRVAVEKGGVGIADLHPGGHFGEMGLVENAPRSATVRAVAPTVVMRIARAEIMNLMRRDPPLAVKLLWSFVQVLSQRMRSVNAELAAERQDLESAIARGLGPFGN